MRQLQVRSSHRPLIASQRCSRIIRTSTLSAASLSPCISLDATQQHFPKYHDPLYHGTLPHFSVSYYLPIILTPTPAPPQAMVGGSTSSLRSFFSLSLSLAAAADAGSARILKGAASALIPQRNGWTSRIVRNRNRNRNHAYAHPGLPVIPAPHPVIAGDNNNNYNNSNSNHSTDSLSAGRSADSDSSPVPTAANTRGPSPVPVLAITCGAVGGIIALAVVLAIVYIRRIKRRVKSMKKRTNILGPGTRVFLLVMFIRSIYLVRIISVVLFYLFILLLLLELAPMSPSQLSHLSPIDSPRVKFDGKHLGTTSSVTVSSPMCIELPGIIPLSPIRTSTFILSPPPAAKRIPVRFSNPNPHPYPRSPVFSSRAAVPWPLTTTNSSSNHRSSPTPLRRTEHKF